ncbi:hypothetical protein CFA70_28730 (plasmid) [Citrobacter freundii]|nr:hypothetical protein CFA70_28730 [Citrobacter freundii]
MIFTHWQTTNQRGPEGPLFFVAGDNLHESIIGLLPAGPLREYFEDPGVFEVRINRYNEVVCDTFEGRKIIQNDSITGAFIDNLTAALTSANKGSVPAEGEMTP